MWRLIGGLALILSSGTVNAAEMGHQLDLTNTYWGWIAVGLFVLAYVVVIFEESLHLRKSKPVIVAAGVIWLLVAIAYTAHGDIHTPEIMVRHNILEYAELMLFLLAAMTYINTLEERQVFDALRGWLVSKGFSLRTIFWITGFLAFVISPVADNLTTALLMAAVVMAVARDKPAFVAVACVNIVVAANAGGAFSPFGDITTLMVWQKGIIEFHEFFNLVIPSIVNWIVPAFIMSLTIARDKPEPMAEEVAIKKGGLVVIGLFLFTISLAVSFHNFFHLPPMVGMMTGMGILKFYGYYLKRYEARHGLASNGRSSDSEEVTSSLGDVALGSESEMAGEQGPFDIFSQLQRAEWDTLMFFYGVILCVGGLGALGYLGVVSQLMYTDLGPTNANILVGILSAVVDNIPVMFAVLSMLPKMSEGQWLLVTLTAGVGGSMLSVGSAAGVALMGQARGIYTFFAHLKWTWAIALGYAASIWAHLLVNSHLM